VREFRDQVARRLSGALTEEEFKPLRLMNGVYLQLHAYMLRVAIPYGTLSSDQMRMLAHVARSYDRGYGHFTTRQNIQFNWIKLDEMPDAMADLAQRRHARHADQRQLHPQCHHRPMGRRGARRDRGPAGVGRDPAPAWSTMHPEFSFLPRKFKIAVTAATHDRAAVKVHDIGLRCTATRGRDSASR
jgi:sulfite reductase (NADPH) hemoprotein beta-component